MTNAQTLEVRRDNPAEVRIVQESLPDSLEDGQVLLAVDRFAVTANNITYIQIGESFGYWRFFPTDEDAWGRVPAMGYATVADSAHPEINRGERVWGFFPMGTHLVINAGNVSPHGFSDVSPHREGLAPIYANFQRASSNSLYEESREEQDSLLRGLFLTSWLCEDALYDQDFHGAGDCIISSASSKTSIALAFAVRERGTLRSIALTSERNRAFCKALGCYDEVVTYDEIDKLNADRGTILVDMAGNAGVNNAIHHHYGDRLRYDLRIGVTHREALPETDDDLPGPKPEIFFAPHQAGKRSAEWGAAVFEQRVGSAFGRFRQFSDSWLHIKRFDGAEAAQEAFRAVLNGEASPQDGYTVSLREDA